VLRRAMKPIASAARAYLTARLESMLAELQTQICATQLQLAGLSEHFVKTFHTDSAGEEARTTNPTSLDMNLLLHQSRAAMLRQMPKGATTMLSAGCSGTWYFNWIEQCYGRVPAHIGVEFYSPCPSDLPENANWIANSVSDMSDVADSSCDLVFSGQNIEHLWPDEVIGFMIEAARVTRPGGTLVIDSPNRVVTEALNWSHPEHTIELAIPEMAKLFTLAGFDVIKTVGIWLCRDPRTGRFLPFDANVADAEWSVTERLVGALAAPDYAFIWWMEGRRNDSPPDRRALRAAMNSVFSIAWPERIQRVISHEALTRTAIQSEWIHVPAGWVGVAMFGPYMPLRAGRYTVSLDLEPAVDARDGYATCDVVWGTACTQPASIQAPAAARQISLSFSLSEIRFGLQFRCIANGGASYHVRRGVLLHEDRSYDVGPPRSAGCANAGRLLPVNAATNGSC
jgi:SAM-dependent methyltransferase